MPAYKFSVDMSCEGCSGAITRILNKHKDKGVETFDVNLSQKLVVVESTTLSEDDIKAILQKFSKEKSIEFIGMV